MSRMLKILALLTGASALLCVTLWATVWAPGEGVAPSRADIADLFSREENDTQKFQRALEHLGHEPPRAFDMNGNTIYFSVNFLAHSPDEVLRRYQDEFVYQGINQKSYTTVAEARGRQARLDMLTGGIVPTEISSGYVAMGGGLSENFADDEQALGALAQDFAAGRIDKKFRAYRHIEAFREPNARFTTVVASWSDESFDYRKMIAGSQVGGQNSDPRVPACPGCTRVQRFEDLDPEADHVDHIFTGPSSVQKTLSFYDRALPQRGWKHAPASAVLARARRLDLPLPDARMRHYQRGRQTLTLLAYVDDRGETLVHLTLSN